MLFWIFLVTNMFTLLILHITMRESMSAGENNILTVKIPRIHFKDERVKAIIERYEKSRKKILWIFLLLQIVGYPIREYFSLTMLWFYIYIFAMIYVYTVNLNRYANQLKELKKTEGWGEAKEEREKRLNPNEERLYVDDEEYWTRFMYCNPHDKRLLVPAKVGSSLTINLGRTAGKIVMLGIGGVTIAVIIWSIVVAIPIDFAVPTMTLQDDIIIIDGIDDTLQIEKEEIESVQLITEIPSTYKRKGSATERVKSGKFRVKEKGEARLEVMVKVPLYIELELTDDTYVYFNGQTEEITENYFEQIGTYF